MIRKAQVGPLVAALIAFSSVMLLGVVIYGTAWWQGPGISIRFTKWFFGLFLAAAAVTGMLTFVGILSI